MGTRVVTILFPLLVPTNATEYNTLSKNKTENIVVDIVRVAASIPDDEGLHEEHGLVVVDLGMKMKHGTCLNLSSAADHDASIASGLNVHALDVVGEASADALRITPPPRKKRTAILVIIACVPRNS